MGKLQKTMSLKFEPIKSENFSLAYGFLRHSFAISFGEDDHLWPERLRKMTEIEYFKILRNRLSKHSEAAVHAFDADRIIGQVEWSIKTDDETCGYINLYYLIPSQQSLGLGKYLDQFATEKLANLGCKKIQLNVGPTNSRAIAFYKKTGWIEVDQYHRQNGILMEKIISPFFP